MKNPKSKLLSTKKVNYKPKDETQIKDIIYKHIIQQRQSYEITKKAKRNRTLKGLSTGSYPDKNLKYYIRGIEVLKMIFNGGLIAYNQYLNLNTVQDDKKNSKATMLGYALVASREIINSALDIVEENLREKHQQSREIYLFEETCKLLEQARDIVTEDIEQNGVTTKRKLSSGDIYARIQNLVNNMDRRDEQLFDQYICLGQNVISFIGAMTQCVKTDKKEALLLGIGTGISTGTELYNIIVSNEQRNELYSEFRKDDKELKEKEHKFLSIKPVNKQDVDEAKREVVEAKSKYIKRQNEIENFWNKKGIKNKSIYIAILGAIVALEISKNKENLKPKDLPKLILSIMSKNNIIHLGEKSMRIYDKISRNNEIYIESLRKTIDIAEQIEEKSKSLSVPKETVNMIQIKGFNGEFYRTYDGETESAECIINIPKLEIKSGQTILITGNSGSGKSTLLKFLRDGDISNKGAIIINGEERVDKLGRDIVSMCEAKMELSSPNILYDITGKEQLKDLALEQRTKLEEIIKDLGLERSGAQEKISFLRRCEYKSYNQFSTGQQKRLELAKALYAIDGNSQVILLDETVSNIQKDLGENAFKLINKYSKRGKPKIIIMVSHDIESASKYADKRYHIDENGVMSEVILREQESR